MNPIEDTQAWLEAAVIGLNLCPFAKTVHAKGQIRWVESRATQPRELLGDLVAELRALDAADPEAVDTTLLVCPQVLQDFLDFNDFLDVADGALEDLGLEGTLQIAAFHPQFQFEGTEPDDPGNFSNRSPHPTLHLLREASLDRAVEAFPEAETIYERNIATLRGLTPAQWQAVFGPRAPRQPGTGEG
ncbi:MAG: DUF1415 domain-containing protein [Rubrivivax sp.]|nr:DUF1415 domain-containing protein [Rubrivivax sp.]